MLNGVVPHSALVPEKLIFHLSFDAKLLIFASGDAKLLIFASRMAGMGGKRIFLAYAARMSIQHRLTMTLVALALTVGLSARAHAQDAKSSECFDVEVLAKIIAQVPTVLPESDDGSIVMSWPWFLDLKIRQAHITELPAGKVTIIALQHTYYRSNRPPYIIRTWIHGWRQVPELQALLSKTLGSGGRHSDDGNVPLSAFHKPIAPKIRTATNLRKPTGICVPIMYRGLTSALNDGSCEETIGAASTCLAPQLIARVSAALPTRLQRWLISGFLRRVGSG